MENALSVLDVALLGTIFEAKLQDPTEWFIADAFA